jgi:hypothetical protein
MDISRRFFEARCLAHILPALRQQFDNRAVQPVNLRAYFVQ